MQIISIPIFQQVLSVANNEKNTSRYELSKGGNNQWHFVNTSLQSSDVHDVFTWTNSAGDASHCGPFSHLVIISCREEGCRLEICHDRRDRRSCKIFATCVNFSKKQRSFLNIFQVYIHLNVNFLHKC